MEPDAFHDYYQRHNAGILITHQQLSDNAITFQGISIISPGFPCHLLLGDLIIKMFPTFQCRVNNSRFEKRFETRGDNRFNRTGTITARGSSNTVSILLYNG